MSIPRATVRLQFHRGFTLDDAIAVVPYYAALGISHVYASPLLASRRGSTHGYDGVRTDCIDAELGGEPALRRLVTALREHGMGMVLDLVPNHMSASLENPWWLDVLEHGRDSSFAGFFDIDWEAGNGRVLLPWLEGAVHAALDRGDAALRHDAETRRLYVHVAAVRVPLSAASYADVLAGDHGNAHPELHSLSAHFEAARTAAEFDAAREMLADAVACAGTLHAALEAALERYLPVDADGASRLRALLARQPWQLADWHAAPQRINWRRFFDIGALVALRVELPEVFDAVHAYPLALFAEGLVDGLRIDHVDGLRDPAGYCRRLRAELQRRAPRRPDGLSRTAWLLVEKILGGDEALRQDWEIDGSTGYDFMEQVGMLIHAGSGEPQIDASWRAVAPAPDETFAAMVLRARGEILHDAFAADLRRARRSIAAWLDLQAEEAGLGDALAALIVHFPVYRTYADSDGCAAPDRDVLRCAAQAADATLGEHARSRLWQLVDAVCTPSPDPSDAAPRADALAALQQLTPPIAAKAIEDTVFYRYGRLLSRNEVGADPDRLAAPVQRFHDQCIVRARDWPEAMLATATHDHKRGEDARARLAVLSEDASWWDATQRDWSLRNRALRAGPDAGAPDAADEYMLYQALLGGWPPALAVDDHHGIAAFGTRVAGWLEKALREAKRHSSWDAPAQAYEAGCAAFLASLLDDPDFVAQLHAAVQRIAPAGAAKGLAQALLRITVPGVPDLYQGCEFWDHSLVDPDNRRPVDHEARRQALADDPPLDLLLANWRDGHIKQRLIAGALQARRRHPRLFARGGYLPVVPTGPACADVVVFARTHESTQALVVAAVHQPVATAADGIRVPPDAFTDTVVQLPAMLQGDWHDVLADRAVHLPGQPFALAMLADGTPARLLLRPGSC